MDITLSEIEARVVGSLIESETNGRNATTFLGKALGARFGVPFSRECSAPAPSLKGKHIKAQGNHPGKNTRLGQTTRLRFLEAEAHL